jgi:uncharacterized protein
LKIRVDEIKDEEIRLVAEEPLNNYPVLLELSSARECEFLSPINVELVVFREFDHIRVNGRVETTVRLSCSRCLAEFDANVKSLFTLFYNKTSGLPLEEEQELTETDLDSASYEGDYIDFTAEISEQVLMEIPFKPLCKEDCSGLCSNCGADLNTVDCGCSHTETNLKFAALKNFKVIK